jgi:hypothetical protein
MAEKYQEKDRFDGQKVQILMPEYVEGSDEDTTLWRANITAVNIGEESNPVRKYLTTAERYFYSTDWFGSEKRKNPA